jgi:hypothetical protein
MRRSIPVDVTVILLALLFLSPAITAEDQDSQGAGDKKTGVWFPRSDFYPAYVADPLRPQNALTMQWLADSEIPDTGGGRFGLRLGGVFGIRRWHPEGNPDIGWQLTFEGGFAGQFDLQYSLDNIGWDGFFGLYLDRMVSPDFGVRVGTQHDSSHIGDEYSRRTGRERIEYTREELVVGASWRFRRGWRTYAEVGYGAGLDGEGPWSVQAGFEFVSDRKHARGRASRFAALDLRTYQESDWSARLTVQGGYRIPVGDHGAVHRLALEYGTGRSVMGQFPHAYENWFGIGWYYDF